MSDFHHKVYWWVFWIVFLFVLTPITGTYFPRELFVLFIVQPAVAALIAWIFVVLPVKLADNYQRKCRAGEEKERVAKLRVQQEVNKAAALQAYQKQRASNLDSLLAQSVASARELPNLIAHAEKSLDLAEYEFGEGAFVPFWDAIELATRNLATVERTVRQLIQNSQSYQEGATGLGWALPPFQLGLDTLPDPSRITNRLRTIVRRAQKDPDFTKIYLMCRHNELLVAGFSTLGQALSEIGDRLDSSLDRLASSIRVSISGLASEITSSQKQMTSTLEAGIQRFTEQNASDAKAERELGRKGLEMLDNIQRRRPPRPRHLRDGEY